MDPSCTVFCEHFLSCVLGPPAVCWCARMSVWSGHVRCTVTSCDPLSWRVCSARRESCLRTCVRVHEDQDDLSRGQPVQGNTVPDGCLLTPKPSYVGFPTFAEARRDRPSACATPLTSPARLPRFTDQGRWLARMVQYFFPGVVTQNPELQLAQVPNLLSP